MACSYPLQINKYVNIYLQQKEFQLIYVKRWRSDMLKNGVGEMFSPAEKWRVERKKPHRLNQVYNSLPEDQPKRRQELLDL